jgi:hypothetical protein
MRFKFLFAYAKGSGQLRDVTVEMVMVYINKKRFL